MKVLLKYNHGYALFFAFIFFISCKEHTSDAKLKTEQGNALGTTYTITYEIKAEMTGRITQELDALFAQVNASMSTYIPESDISKINKGDSSVIVDAAFREVYNKANEVWKNSEGRFDPTVGALVNAWGFGPEGKINTITQQQIDSILKFTGFDKVKLTQDGKIIKSHPAVYLDFNALAKGYTIDLIGQMLEQKGIENYLVELGGEILARGFNTQTQRDWRVAIDHPVQESFERKLISRIKLKDMAIATSGNYRKFRIDPETGSRYVHIINPKTGYSQKSNILSVSVVAPSCMEADAYATAFMVMPLETIKALAVKLGLEVHIVSASEDGVPLIDTTRGFRSIMIEN